jgi:hypothetical protein
MTKDTDPIAAITQRTNPNRMSLRRLSIVRVGVIIYLLL